MDNKLSLCFKNNKNVRNLFFVYIGLCILHFILNLSPTITAVIPFFYNGNTSILDLTSLLTEVSGYDRDAEQIFGFIKTAAYICPVLNVLSMIPALLPVLTGKIYKKRYIVLSLIAIIYSAVIQTLLFMMYKYVLKDMASINITFAGILYYIAAVISIAVFFIFVKKLKDIGSITAKDFESEEVFS